MRAYRVFFKKNGINLTKLVYAESLLEVINQFKGLEVMMIKELDLLPIGDIEIIAAHRKTERSRDLSIFSSFINLIDCFPF